MFKFFKGLGKQKPKEKPKLNRELKPGPIEKKLPKKANETNNFMVSYNEAKDFVNFYMKTYKNYGSKVNELGPETWSTLKNRLPALFNGSCPKNHTAKIFNSVLLIHVTEWLIVTGYGKKLDSKMSRLLYEDDYGDINTDDADKEAIEFTERKFDDIRHYVASKIPLEISRYAVKSQMREKLLNCYPGKAEERRKSIFEAYLAIRMGLSHCKESATEFETANPYEYETRVATKLKSLGWSARTTSGSGDQGADVIAEIKEVLFVIQCKLYTGPVGNKAVQEVFAAKGYYDANVAAVVTNQTYTKSAKKLAHKLGVLLLHHDELESTCEELRDLSL